jgi:putative RNA 2'-phosphotransferase
LHNEKKIIKIGRTLCYVLRHNPSDFNVTMTSDGWVSVPELLVALNLNTKLNVTLEELLYSVQYDSKKRYVTKGHNQFIRANQGHSLSVDIQYKTYILEDDIYHGTSVSVVDKILKEGLTPQKRNYVHLSKDIDTAKVVGKRHTRDNTVAILVISKDSKADFYITENGIIHAKHVPPEDIKEILYKETT